MGKKVLKLILTALLILPITLILLVVATILRLLEAIAPSPPRGKDHSPPREIVFVTYAPFRGLFDRHLQIATKLSRTHPVLYCDLISISTLILSPGLIRELGFARVAPRLFRFAALILPLDGRSAPFTFINRFILISYLKAAIRRAGFSHFALFLWEPNREYLVGRLGESLVIYDIIDEYSEFLGSARKILSAEERLFPKTDLIITGTYSLFLSRREKHKNIHFIPCGVDYELFSSSPSFTPEELTTLPHPVIGYYGMLDARLDIDLLRFLGEKHPDWSFVLIGPLGTDLSALMNLRNFHLLGRRSYRSLPSYIAFFDIVIIPYRLNRYTEHINPNKMLEILAAGKPVVTTDLPDIRRFYSDIAFVSQDYRQFADNIKRALSDKKEVEERIVRGKKMARENSWDEVAEKIKELVKNTYLDKIGSKGRGK